MHPHVLVVLCALALSGCEAQHSAADAVGDGDADADVTVVMDEMAYEPSVLEVPAGQRVTLELVNAGNLRHDLHLPDGTRSATLNAGEFMVVEAGPFSTSGVGWCSVPGHRDAGMELDVRVER